MLSIQDRWREAAGVPDLLGVFAALRPLSPSLATNPAAMSWFELLGYPSFDAFDKTMRESDLWGSAGRGKNTAQKISALLAGGVEAYLNGLAEGCSAGGKAKMPWLRIGGGPTDYPVRPSISGITPRVNSPAIDVNIRKDDGGDDDEEGEEDEDEAGSGSGMAPMDDASETSPPPSPTVQRSTARRISGGPELTPEEMSLLGQLTRRSMIEVGGIRTVSLPARYFGGKWPLTMLVIPNTTVAEAGDRTLQRRAGIVRFVTRELSHNGSQDSSLALIRKAHAAIVRKNKASALSILGEERLDACASIRLYLKLGSFSSYRVTQSGLNFELSSNGRRRSLLLPINQLRLLLSSCVLPVIHARVRLLTKAQPHNGSFIHVWYVEEPNRAINERMARLFESHTFQDRYHGASVTLIVDSGGGLNKVFVTIANGLTPGAPHDGIWMGNISGGTKVIDCAANWRRAIFHGPVLEGWNFLFTQNAKLLMFRPEDPRPLLTSGATEDDGVDALGKSCSTCILALAPTDLWFPGGLTGEKLVKLKIKK